MASQNPIPGGSVNEAALISNPQALLDRIKSKEEEIKKKERELKLREAQVKERTDELESAKAQVDSMMSDVERREQTIADLEKKHGNLSRREESSHQRDMLLSDREVQLQDKAADLLRREKEEKVALRNKAKDTEMRLRSVEAREEAVVSGETRISSVEQEYQEKYKAFKDEQYRQDFNRSERDREFRSQEVRVRDEWRSIETRQNELDASNAELQDRLKFQRTEQVEMESRERDFKWRDELLKQGLEETTKKKKELEAWDALLQKRAVQADVTDNELAFRKDTLEEGELRLKQRLSSLFTAQKEIHNKDHANEKIVSDLEHREAKIRAEQYAVRLEAEEIREQHRLALVATQHAREVEKDMSEKQHILEEQTLLMREKERALKDWIVELEFRSSTIRRKELKPAPYLQRFASTGAETSDFKGNPDEPGNNSNELDSFDIAPQFSEALTNMTLQRLQGAYLGATMKSRNRRTQQQETRRRTTALRDSTLEGTGDALEVQCAGQDVVNGLASIEDEFRDLMAGYMAMTKEKRSQLFTQIEEVQLVEGIEFDVTVHDEQAFLEGLIASPVQGVELNISAQDSKLLTVVTKWINDRSEMLNARWRRLAEKKVTVYSGCLTILQGKISKAEHRRVALNEKFSDGSVGLSTHFKERSRARLPAVIPAGTLDATLSMPMSRAATPSLGANRSAVASRGSNSRGGVQSQGGRRSKPKALRALDIQQSLDVTSNIASPKTGPSGGGLQSQNPEEAMVDALPLYLRHHYPDSRRNTDDMMQMLMKRGTIHGGASSKSPTAATAKKRVALPLLMNTTATPPPAQGRGANHRRSDSGVESYGENSPTSDNQRNTGEGDYEAVDGGGGRSISPDQRSAGSDSDDGEDEYTRPDDTFDY